MDQENYNDIDMEIEMDSNDIDVSAEMPNEIVVNNYNSLKNKPSINSVELVGNKTLEDLGITEYVEGEIANFDFIKIVPQLPEKGLINRTYFVPKTDPESNDLYEEYMWINNKWEMMGTKQIQVDLTAYVKNTDYAKPDKGGTIKTGNGVSLKNGVIQTDSIDYNAYKDSSNEYFIGKGTLEKVIEGKELINKEYSDNIIEEQRLENERLRNDIKSIALPGEASGENIHLEDSSEARCEIEICGNQKQETREGYNQLKNEGTTQTLNNVTITKKEDETLVVNGTATENFTFSIKRNIELEDGEQYKLSGCPNGGAEKKYALTINQYYENQSHFEQDYGDGVNFTYNGSLPINNNIYIRLFKGITYNNLIFKPMIVKGTENKPYEQYGASPSPDYPSEIKTVGSNINLFDKDNQDMFLNGLIPNNAGEIQVGTTNTSASKYIVTIIVPCLPNSTYIISRYAEGKTFFVYESSKKDLEVGDNVTFLKRNDNTGVINEKIITGANAKYLLVKIYNTYAIEQNIYNDLISSVKIEKGTVATPYSPYGMGSVGIDVVNSNLLDFNVTQNNKVTVNEDGTITINGQGEFALAFKRFTAKANTKYYIKWELVSGTVSGANIFMNPILKKGWINKDTFVESSVTEDSKISGTWINGGAVFSNAKIKIWISKSQNDFTKHQSQSVIMPIQQEMLTGDYVADVEHHEWGKLIFNENSDMECIHSDKTFQFRFLKYIEGTDATTKVICNMAKYWNIGTWEENGCFISFNGYFCILCKENEFGFNADMTTDEAITHFKTILANSKLIVYYKLAIPINLELTEEQKAVAKKIKSEAHTYKNITNISAESAEVNPIINVKYLKDTEKYIEDKITTALTEINALNQVRTQMLDAEVEI